MRIVIGGWFDLLLVLVVGGFVLYALVYWAVRMALTDHRGFPRFSCYVSAAENVARITFSNVGPAPAFDLAILWGGMPRSSPMAEAAVLAPFASVTWRLSAPDVETSAALSAGPLAAAYLVVYWRMAGASSRRVVWIPIRVPASVIGTRSTVEAVV